MRQLRVVGLGDDHETVILEDPIRHERFAVSGDERLRAAARGDVRRLGQMEIEVSSPLRPRDIQARVRAGESVDEVASAAGVSTSHVERFAYPVLLERARVAEIARRAHPVLPTDPTRTDGRTLGDTAMRTRTSTSIVAVVRDHLVSPSPGPEFVFRAGDLVVVVGTGEGLGQAAAILENG